MGDISNGALASIFNKCSRYVDSLVRSYIDAHEENAETRLMATHFPAVLKAARTITNLRELSNTDKAIAYVIAALHDAGRLSQDKLVGRNDDATGLPHAFLSCLKAQEKMQELLSPIKVTDLDEIWTLVMTAVLNHTNMKGAVLNEDKLTERQRLHLETIKEADAMANLSDKFPNPKNAADLMEVNGCTLEGLIKSDFSQDVLDTVLARKGVNYEEIRKAGNTPANWYLAWMAHGYNIVNKFTAQALLNGGYLGAMATIVDFEKSATSAAMLQAAEAVNSYLEEIAYGV
ncbi:MAG: HD domain-containing protein [Candidatus Nomurabacteria bacterium]|jgi:hypothetical protein|nr:HD domain-containing protein [Candidatus Nomurabacteria bacterium]